MGVVSPGDAIDYKNSDSSAHDTFAKSVFSAEMWITTEAQRAQRCRVGMFDLTDRGKCGIQSVGRNTDLAREWGQGNGWDAAGLRHSTRARPTGI